MDIQAWLSETQAPSLQREARSTDPRKHQLRDSTRALDHASYQKSDRGDHLPTHQVRPFKESARKRQKGLSPSDAPDESSTSATASSISKTSSLTEPKVESFERRKRHRTRENLYEPGAILKRKSKKKHAAEQDKKAKQQTKHHRTKKAKNAANPGLQMLQGFSAPNMGEGRLTLHSPARQGVFRKGRASEPQYRRGLPDLTFSEMRFLSRPIERNDIVEANQPSRSTLRKKRHQSQEHEEISAFFTGNRRALEERDTNAPSKKRITSLAQPSESLRPVTQDRGFRKDGPASQITSQVSQTQRSARHDEGLRSKTAFSWPSTVLPAQSASVCLRPPSTIAQGELLRPKDSVDTERVLGQPSGVAGEKRTKQAEEVQRFPDPSCCKLAAQQNYETPLHQQTPKPDKTISLPGPTAAKLRLPKHDRSRVSEGTPQSSASPLSKLLRACDDATRMEAKPSAPDRIQHQAPRCAGKTVCKNPSGKKLSAFEKSAELGYVTRHRPKHAEFIGSTRHDGQNSGLVRARQPEDVEYERASYHRVQQASCDAHTDGHVYPDYGSTAPDTRGFRPYSHHMAPAVSHGHGHDLPDSWVDRGSTDYYLPISGREERIYSSGLPHDDQQGACLELHSGGRPCMQSAAEYEDEYAELWLEDEVMGDCHLYEGVDNHVLVDDHLPEQPALAEMGLSWNRPPKDEVEDSAIVPKDFWRPNILF